MKQKMYFFLLAISSVLLLAHCTRDLVLTPPDPVNEEVEALSWTPDQGILKFLSDEDKQNAVAEDLEFIDRILKNPKAEDLRSRGVETHIPAGSNNALAAAIAAAGVDDVIILDAGDHKETETVVINKKVQIKGAAGANLIFSNIPASLDYVFKTAIHITSEGAGSSIKGINFTDTDPIAGIAIFIDSTSKIKILQNTFSNWQGAVFAYSSSRVVITQNKIAASKAWQTGVIPESQGIVFSDGDHNSVVLNTITGGLFGIWTGGSLGLDFSNTTEECLYGQILCKVPPGFYTINNRTLQTQGSSYDWKVKYNMSNNNIAAGYLVIDGATSNWLQHNCASGNGTYAFELTGDSYRFGFFTPKSVNNTVIAYRNLTVKDCGENNAVIGGIWVNTNEDPCN